MVDRDLTVIAITQVGMPAIVISPVGTEAMDLLRDLIEVGRFDLPERLLEVMDLPQDLTSAGVPDLSQDLIREGGLDLPQGLISAGVPDLPQDLISAGGPDLPQVPVKNIEVVTAISANLEVPEE